MFYDMALLVDEQVWIFVFAVRFWDVIVSDRELASDDQVKGCTPVCCSLVPRLHSTAF